MANFALPGLDFLFEIVELEGDQNALPEVGDEAITSLKYFGGYGGGGVALSW